MREYSVFLMVTATQLSSYLYCPRKLFIGSVLKIVEPPKAALVKGEVWHKTNEWINKHEQEIVERVDTANFMDISDIYRKEFAKTLRNTIIRYKNELKKFEIKLIDLFNEYWPDIDEEAKRRAYNVSLFASKNKIFGKELWAKLSPKILSEQYFKSEKLGLSGVIDVIEVYDNILYVPVELKTGTVPQGNNAMWPGHKIQLGVYLMLLEDAGKQVSEGVLKYKGSEDKKVLVLNSFLKDEVLELVKAVNKIIKTFEIPERVDNKKKCEKCSFKEKCYDDKEMEKLVGEAKKRKNSF
jgi:CRISPR-associated protein Cas4